MCGIIYAQNFNGQPVNVNVFDQYVSQRSRGHEGFGLFNGKHLVHAAQEERIINWLVKPKNDSDMLLFHHRFPTSTINVKKAAHPFTSKKRYGDTEYVMIHNGVITNAKELRQEHEAKGITYHSVLDNGTFNDSEALMWDLAETLEGNQEKLTAYGMIAFICVKLVKGVPERLYFGRNTRPLNMTRTKTNILLSSEGEGEAIKADQLYTYNYQLKRLTKRYFKVPSFKPYDPETWANWNQSHNANSGFHSNALGAGRSYNVPSYSDVVYEDDYRYSDYEDEEYENFPNYGSRRFENQSRAMVSIGAYLRSKFGKDVEAEDYEWNQEAHMFVPSGTTAADIDMLYQEAKDPDPKQVRRMANLYLVMNNASFQQAIWHVSEDLDELLQTNLDQERMEQQKLLERVEAYLEDDPEFLDDDSVSSSVMEGTVYGNE